MTISTEPNPIRAAVYVRISEDHRDGAGVARQEKECRELADRLGWTVIEVFEDNDISASSFTRKQRTAYQNMVEAITTGHINAVISWHSDRMFRRVDEHEHYIQLSQRHNVHNAAVRVGAIDYDTPSGRFNARMAVNMSSYESEHKADRLRSLHRDIARNGGFHGGIRCFGYEPDGLTVREPEAHEIRRVADAILGGQSLRSLAKELNGRGIKTVTGKGPWTSSHLRKMIMRPRLAGLRVHDDKQKGPQQYPAAWPPILARETWEAITALLADPGRNTNSTGVRGPIPTTLGTGIYVCGVCQQPRMRRAMGSDGRRVYRCGNYLDGNGGSHVTRVAEPLDEYVTGALLQKLSAPGMIEALCNVIDTDDTDLGALRQERDNIRTELRGLAAKCNAGDIDDEQLAIASRRRRVRDNEITATLKAAVTRSPVHVLLGATSIEHVWDDVLTLGQRRAILAEVLTVTVLPGRGGRSPDGSYFNAGLVRIELTDRARAAIPK